MPNYATASYSNLKASFQALVGLETLQSIDATFLRDLVNRRARIAHERYPWPQFTVIGESVTLTSADNNRIRIYGTDNKLSNDANVVFKIHKTDPAIDEFPDEYVFYSELDSAGYPSVKIVDEGNLGGSSIYITYRKDLKSEINSGTATSGQYGEGADDEQNIPEVFFDYMVYGAYADFLRSDGQTQKAALEEQNAENLIARELDIVREQGRQFRNDTLQYRSPSQFRRHNIEAGGQPVATGDNP
jgi:hypothetical protein